MHASASIFKALFLQIEQLMISPLEGHELAVRPIFHNRPVLHHSDLVGPSDRREPMRDVDGCRLASVVSGQTVYTAKQLRFGLRVERRRWLTVIQPSLTVTDSLKDDEIGFVGSQKGAGERDSLPLASR